MLTHDSKDKRESLYPTSFQKILKRSKQLQSCLNEFQQLFQKHNHIESEQPSLVELRYGLINPFDAYIQSWVDGTHFLKGWGF